VDIVVLAVGTDLSWAAEGHDATSITFSNGQRQLIQQVANAAKKPVIVVHFSAVPLDLSEVLANPKVGAVLHVGQPAVQTLGIGDLLFGLKVPAGRTVQTFLPVSYAQQISIFDFNMRPGSSVWPRPDCTTQPQSNCPNGTNPGRTYRFYNGNPVVPFGFGLSYTTFIYQMSEYPQEVISLNPVRKMLSMADDAGLSFPSLTSLYEPLALYQVNVTNTGNYDADDSVLGFITPPNAGKDGNPIKYLFGFERVHVLRGQTVTVTLNPSLGDFTRADENGKRVPVPGDYIVQFGIPETTGQGYAVHKIRVV